MQTRELQEVRAALDALLLAREAAFPQRDAANTAAMHRQVAAFAALLARQNPRAAWRPEDRLREPIDRFIAQPVFICGYLKSGTTLMVELLDGHPQLVVMPGDTHMLRLMDQFGGTADAETRERWELRWLTRMINPKGQRPFWILGEDAAYAQLQHALRYWFERLADDARAPFLAALLAYFCANPTRPPQPAAWISKTPRNERHVATIRRLYPGARFIHVRRHPLYNLASLRRLAQARGWRWSTPRALFSILHSRLLGGVHRRRLGSDTYHLVTYEALVQETPWVMQQTANFLGVAHSDALLQPTVNGLPTTANSMYRERQQAGKVLQSPPRSWRDTFSAAEQRYLAWVDAGYAWHERRRRARGGE